MLDNCSRGMHRISLGDRDNLHGVLQDMLPMAEPSDVCLYTFAYMSTIDYTIKLNINILDSDLRWKGQKTYSFQAFRS
jgi:hypothetical protein